MLTELSLENRAICMEVSEVRLLFQPLDYVAKFYITTCQYLPSVALGIPIYNNNWFVAGCMYCIISQIRPPPLATTPHPPNSLMKTTAQVLLSVKTLTVTNNLCDVYKLCSCLCSWSFLLTSYHKSFLSTISIFNCGTWLRST